MTVSKNQSTGAAKLQVVSLLVIVTQCEQFILSSLTGAYGSPVPMQVNAGVRYATCLRRQEQRVGLQHKLGVLDLTIPGLLNFPAFSDSETVTASHMSQHRLSNFGENIAVILHAMDDLMMQS